MKHNDIISELEKRLKENHKEAIIHREEEFDLRRGKHGECDLYLVDLVRDYAYLIEVKTYNGKRQRKKAHKQLQKDVRYIKECYNIDRMFKFYAYSNKNWYKIERYI
jgi:hypothetical protein